MRGSKSLHKARLGNGVCALSQSAPILPAQPLSGQNRLRGLPLPGSWWEYRRATRQPPLRARKASHTELGTESGSGKGAQCVRPSKALGLRGELVCSWGEQKIMKSPRPRAVNVPGNLRPVRPPLLYPEPTTVPGIEPGLTKTGLERIGEHQGCSRSEREKLRVCPSARCFSLGGLLKGFRRQLSVLPTVC